jgi:hypothetical protein
MADRKISQLAQLQTAEDQDYLPIVDNSEGETKRILVGNLLTDQLTPAERTKLQGISEGATANQTDAHLLNRANHTGTQSLSTLSDVGSSAIRDVPLFGDANDSMVVLGNDSRLTNARTPTAHNHTASEITDFNSSVDARISGSAGAGHGSGSVTLHQDVSNAGSGSIITNGERTKLNGIETGATANSSDADLKNRANHTGTQANTTITGLGTASTKNVGTSANQVVQLDAQAKLPAVDGSQLTNIALVLTQ